MTDEVFIASNGINGDQEFWKSIEGREPTIEEIRAVREWKNNANVKTLLMMNPPKAAAED